MLWFLELVRDSARDITRHKLRSALALLGIVFGIAAVITIMGIGEGAQRTVLKEMSVLGLRNIIVDAKKPEDQQPKSQSGRVRLDYGVTYRDVTQVEGALPAGSSVAACRRVHKPLFHHGRRHEPRIYGVPPHYFGLFNSQVVEGTTHGVLHERDRKRVVVVNRDLADRLPEVGGLVGKTVKIGFNYFEVIGVVDVPVHQGAPHAYMPRDAADRLYGEVSTEYRESGGGDYTRVEIDHLVVQVPTEAGVPRAVTLVEDTLARNHPREDYALTVPLQMLRSKQKTQRILNIVLFAIAFISLVVGGIGIMNIMLANVSERMGEIGIRRAIGATRRDVVLQFLVESTTLTFLGGILGCVVGILAVPSASGFIGFEGAITFGAVAVSLLVSVGVGLVFGIFPALNAAKLDPGNVLTQY